MDAVSNVDQIVLVLRQRLLERSRASATAGKKGARGAASGGRASSLAKVKALASVEGVNDRQLRRALVQNILSDQFGAKLVNEAKFQQVVDQVSETLEEDERTAALLSRLIADLRN